MQSTSHILIVDDQLENLLILEELLQTSYTVRTASDGREALEYLASGALPDLILLDVIMPVIDGFEVCRQIKQNPLFQAIPVLFLTSLESATAEEYALSLGAEDFIHKPFSPAVVRARVHNHLQLSRTSRLLRARNQDLEQLVVERTCEIQRQADELMRRKQQVIAAQAATITAFCSLAETRDNETGNHIRRTQHYVQALAERLRQHPRFQPVLDDDTISLLFKSAPLHDVGKVGIPDAILLKPGKLTPAEWAMMQRHCEYGRDAIALAESEVTNSEQGSFLRYAKEIAYSHHERWNGAGYPQGLIGEAIPLSARLMAIADVYDALISRRVYKAPIAHQDAITMMAEERGAHFDPDMVDALLAIADTFHDIARRYCDPADAH